MNARLFVTLTFLGAAFCCLSMAGAEPILTADSAGFDYKFEFDVDPTDPSLIDHDGNTLADWRKIGSVDITSEPGIAKFPSSTGTNDGYKSSDPDYLFWGDITDAYTIEIKVKAVSNKPGGIYAGDVYVTSPNVVTKLGLLSYSYEGQHWNRTSLGDALDNHTDFHIFRIAKEGGDNTDDYWVWRDGVLLNADSETPLHGMNITHAPYFAFNIGSGDFRGEVHADYFRFTEGAYAPIPEPSTLVLLLGALALLPVLRRGRRG